MCVTGGITAAWYGLHTLVCFDAAGIGHNKDIAKVTDTCAAEMGMGEADQDGIAIIVSGTPVPSFIEILRSQLYCAKGNACADKDMAVSAAADQRVDKADGFFSQ